MKTHDERFAAMTFASVYPHYVNKVEKKGRTKEELHQVIEWLTGFDDRIGSHQTIQFSGKYQPDHCRQRLLHRRPTHTP